MGWRRERVGYVLVGFGVGALVDSFALHQLLQWHHLWSLRTSDTTLAGLQENTLADGILNMSSLAVLLAGLALSLGRRIEARPLLGFGILGWGLFQVLDHALFHLALGAHHIRDSVDNPLPYDSAFLALGVLLVVAGMFIVQRTDTRDDG